MDTIHVNREELLATLKENREKHKTEFISAKKEWVKQATKALRKAADKAEKTENIDEQPLSKLPKPLSYVESYDDAIARVERDVRQDLELDDREFAAWIQDKWAWRGQFAGTTSLYNNR